MNEANGNWPTHRWQRSRKLERDFGVGLALRAIRSAAVWETSRSESAPCRTLSVGLFLLLSAMVCGCVSTPHFDAGPIASADQNLYGHSRVRSFGPLVESRKSDDGKSFTAVRPFYSRIENAPEDRTVSDIIWPIGMIKERKGETDWRIFPAFGHDFDSGDAESRHRWSFFPLLFGGQDINGEKYFSVFPFGGTLHEFLMQDRINYVLFPLYAYSEHEDNKTHSVLWPIFSRTQGDDVYRWRIFPFYGMSQNKDRWTKRFVMWPFWTSVRYDYPDQPGSGFVLFPLFGKLDVGERHARMILPPFFKCERAENGHRALNCPWPIIQYRSGAINRFYFWPLFGKESTEQERQWFTLWPIVSGRRTDSGSYVARHFRIMPIVSYASKTKKTEDPQADGDVFSRYFKLWPLISYRREDTTSLLRVLALWPLKHTPAIERNWAPLWSLYSRERVGDGVDSELLWGLYRHRRNRTDRRLSIFPLLQSASSHIENEPPRRRWSFLYGLIGYEREGLHKQFRMLYFIKFGRLPEEVAPEVIFDRDDRDGVELK